MTSITCHKCNQQFKYKSLLKRHLTLSSRCKEIIQEQNDIDDNKIKCLYCDKVYTRKDNLTRHYKTSICGNKKEVSESIINKGINSVSIEDLKLLRPDLIEKIKREEKQSEIITPTISIAGNENNVSTNITTNNDNKIIIDNKKIITNNITLNIVNPFCYEAMPKLSVNDMVKTLSCTKPGIEILRIVYSDIQNKNFFKYNMGKQNISVFRPNNSIDIVQEEEFKTLLIQNGINMLKYMLSQCAKELEIEQFSQLCLNVNNVEKSIKELVLDNDLTNYLETEFRRNSKKTQKNLDTLLTLTDNPEIKTNLDKNVKERKTIKNICQKELVPMITLIQINRAIGDLLKQKDLNKEKIRREFNLKKFEESCYYKCIHNRIEKEIEFIDNKKFDRDNPKQNEINSGDIIELHNRIEMLKQSLEDMEKIHKDFNPNKDFTVIVPIIYEIASNKMEELIKIEE